MLGGIRRTNKIIQVAIYCQQIRATMENFSTIVLVIRHLLKGRGNTAVFLIDHTGTDTGDITTTNAPSMTSRLPINVDH